MSDLPLLDRRGLLKLLGCGGCALALPSLSGCTIAEVFGGGDGTLTFNVAEGPFRALGAVDGVAAVDVAGRNVLLIRTTPDAIVAVSRICTHTGCDMAPDRFGTWNGDRLICRCHDSHFDAEGHVLKGPATRDLATFDVEFDAATGSGTLTLQKKSTGIPPEFADLVNPFAGDPAAVSAGEALYQQCVACHGAAGEGSELFMPPASAFNVDQSEWTDGYLFWRIRTGADGGPPFSVMVAYPNLSDDETWQLVTFLRSLAP
ncbi:MAG: Rieske 2Fe-2S domain-containing protein [Myxococcales bacterium]|nr:Rieske 2Fe-2S domain-containing protein [Myxococcales bacterium]MCB1185157.1 Rieske 2Fe-2S domain-containing protein [bacterium]MCB9545404.1 Rieske 2Fe-2S domain-containing protein [Myxococcales bacterium]